MRTTLNLDDQLMESAMRLSGLTEKTAVIHSALREYIQLQASRALAAAGGGDARAAAGARRNPWLEAVDDRAA